MNTFGRILEKYGEETVIRFGKTEINAKTFVQPVVKSGENRVTQLGKVNEGEFYWFAPGYIDLDPCEKITITTQDGTFEVKRAEKYRVMGKVSHWEARLSD